MRDHRSAALAGDTRAAATSLRLCITNQTLPAGYHQEDVENLASQQPRRRHIRIAACAVFTVASLLVLLWIGRSRKVRAYRLLSMHARSMLYKRACIVADDLQAALQTYCMVPLEDRCTQIRIHTCESAADHEARSVQGQEAWPGGPAAHDKVRPFCLP